VRKEESEGEGYIIYTCRDIRKGEEGRTKGEGEGEV
jgi:hypothetical protein